jgi:RNA-directed DNA polymerase
VSGTSRMMREYQVRFCEGLGVKLPGPTRLNQQSTRRAQDRESVSQALERVRLAARRGKKEKFTSLLHHVDHEMLRTSFYALKRDAAPGVDGMTWDTYEQGLDRRIEDLHARVQSGAYRALPSRRSYIPKEDGTRRPLAVTALEDKIVQRAVAAVLSEIYEADFHSKPPLKAA